jgi:hypothetical protein
MKKINQPNKFVFIAILLVAIAFFAPRLVKASIRHQWISSWLEMQTCLPPCWRGILPGNTSIVEAMERLSNQGNVVIVNQGKNYLEWEIEDDSGRAFSSHADIPIQEITISIRSNQNLLISEVVDAYGLPEFVQISNCFDFCETRLVYPKTGLALVLYLPELQETVRITRGSEILRLIFFEPGVNNYKNLFFHENEPAELTEWKGYGEYQYVPGDRP